MSTTQGEGINTHYMGLIASVRLKIMRHHVITALLADWNVALNYLHRENSLNWVVLQ
jgi:hypothetical protein